MAEYVRRKRPPATHPYWARLYDRAHPPGGVVPVAVAAVLGLFLGLYCGLRPSYPLREAPRDAVIIAVLFAVFAFVLLTPILWIGAGRYPSRRQPRMAVLFFAVVITIVIFVVCAVFFSATLVWFSLCAGKGLWAGMAIGALSAAVPAGFFARWSRRNWQARQREWPQWERSPPRLRPAIAPAPVPAPAATPPAEPESPRVEPGLSQG